VLPVLDRLSATAHLTALTNDEHSPLARRAHVLLPLLAGTEHTVATKTYVNSLALLWLLARHWSRALDTKAFDALKTVHDHMQTLLAQSSALVARWSERLGQAQAFVFIGTGLHAVTASQSAMMVMEWLKIPALSASVGAFRHGPIEIVQPGLGIVLFTAPGSSYPSTYRLAQELQSYGASVLLVEHGRTWLPDEPAPETLGLDENLTPLVDVLPVQLFIEALACERGIVPGFRHIEKIVSVI
jgi:glucosamine--fructose-6-phosphate aminotransferase (isomerizing)